jgi:dTMP kinase
VDDDTRGRTFAFLQSGIRVILFAVIAIAPLLAGGFTALVHSVNGSSTVLGNAGYDAIGYNFVLLLAAVVAVWLGVVSYRHMDDRRGVPLRDDLAAALRGGPFARCQHPNGQVRGRRPARAADRLRGRRGVGQDPGAAARDLAA